MLKSNANLKKNKKNNQNRLKLFLSIPMHFIRCWFQKVGLLATVFGLTHSLPRGEPAATANRITPRNVTYASV